MEDEKEKKGSVSMSQRSRVKGGGKISWTGFYYRRNRVSGGGEERSVGDAEIMQGRNATVHRRGATTWFFRQKQSINAGDR